MAASDIAGCRAQVPTGKRAAMHTQPLAAADPGRRARAGRIRSFPAANVRAGRAILMSPNRKLASTAV
jgi:hypothetical protein